MLRRPVPHHAVRRPRLRRRALRLQPVERRGHRVARRHRRRRRSASTASRRGATSPTSRPRPRHGRSARRAAACGCGACTCPTAARWTPRTTPTSWNGLPRCVIRRTGWLTDDPRRRSRSSATGTSHPPTRTSGASSSIEGSTHVTGPERAAFNAIVDAQFTDVVRPFTPGPGGLHLLGLHPAAVPEEPRHAHRLHPRLTGPGRARDPRRDRPGRTRPGKKGTMRPAITRRSWWS